jgi:hypothetical protein
MTMPIPQLGVFVDNRPGSMFEVIRRLESVQVRIFALTIVDAGEFGLIRLIVDDPEKASTVLEEADFHLAKSKKNTEATALSISTEDKISRITKILSDNQINIEYAYSSGFQTDGKTALILRVSDPLKAETVLRESGVIILSIDDLKQKFT